MTAVDYLLKLIAINSVSSSSNREVMDYAKSVLHLAGWTFRESQYRDVKGIEKVNLIAAPPGQDAGDSFVDLAFVCHTDTVPFASHWSAALKPFVDGEFVYGCGACDVKGFLACLLEAASAPRGDWLVGVRIVLTADEEIGCVGAKHLLQSGSFRSRRLIIGEPTSLHVARAGKGYCLTEVLITGVEAHSAHSDQGASAIYAASRIIAKIEEFSDELKTQKHGLFTPTYTTLNVGTIQGGTAKNIVAGECRFLLEWRPVPGLAPTFVPNALQRFADEVKIADDRIRCEVRILREEPGFETAEDSSLVQALVRATSNASTSIPFGSEASVLAARAEETVVFGPGDMRTAHSSRERVPLLELHKTVVILRQLMSC